MKRAVSLVSCLVLLLLMIVPTIATVSAERYSVTLTSSADTVEVGGQVTYTVTLGDDSIATSGVIELFYDATYFKVVSGTFSKAKDAATAMFPVPRFPKRGTIVFDAATVGQVDFAGEYFVFVLEAIAETATPQTVYVEVKLNDSIADTKGGVATGTVTTTVTPAPCEHDWGEGQVTTDATCTAPGVRTYTCSKCQDTKTEPIPALTHNMTHFPAKAATCGAPGNTEYYSCSRCNKYFSDANGTNEIVKDSWVIAASGNHDYDEEVTKQPSCTEKGEKKLTCKVCNHIKTVETPALGHETTLTPAKAATCGVAGNSAYYTCSRCNKYFSDANGANEIAKDSWVIPASGNHDYDEEVTKQPSCTEKGEKKLTCKVCSHTKTVEIPAQGHDMTKTPAKAATCVAAGNTEYYSCSRCQKHFSDVNGANEIAENSWIIPATGVHTYTETVTKKATCTEKGEKKLVCSVCDDTKTVEIDALGHNEETVEVTKPATCIVDGEKVYKCSRCGEVQKTEVIKAEGHKFSTEWTVDVEATVGKAGSKSHHCLNCDERADVTEIPALTDNTPTPKPDTPKTGENNVWYLCVIVLVVVSGAAVTLTVLRKKAR